MTLADKFTLARLFGALGGTGLFAVTGGILYCLLGCWSAWQGQSSPTYLTVRSPEHAGKSVTSVNLLTSL